MDFLRFFVVFILTSSSVFAGLYHCDDVNGVPIPLEDKPPKVNVHFSAPYLRDTAFKNELHQGKKPFLIYYAIDSAEPFMRFSVDLEISKLEKSCQGSSAVNFVGILNSLYVSENKIIICKDRKLSRVSLAAYPELNRSLKEKWDFIGTGDHTGDDYGPWKIPAMYEESSNESFARFPLAHPDFLHDLLTLVTTEKSLFPTSKFMPFLNLKSHGNKAYVLSGLHPCQSDAKTMAQKDYLKKYLSLEDQSLLHDSGPGHTEYERILDQLQLGATSVSDHLGAEHLGAEHLGAEHLGAEHLGAEHLGAASGLGSGSGLGAEFAFGTIHVALNFVLRQVFNGKDGKVMGFVMLESCDTDRDYVFNNTYLENTLGFYSSKHSLWYRNLNWWTLLEKSAGSTTELLKILDRQTRQIKNLEIIRN